jgi:hypothetical protein
MLHCTGYLYSDVALYRLLLQYSRTLNNVQGTEVHVLEPLWSEIGSLRCEHRPTFLRKRDDGAVARREGVWGGMEVSGELRAPAALPSGRNSGNH